ncbi:MAG: type II toxin-antitoxin system HicB family antitoxin [Candidatus Hydrogenedentota bacterium]
MMTYKEYIAHVDLDEAAGVFTGRVVNIGDGITFEATTVKRLRKAFREAVDDYLQWCAERGEEPETPYSGKFNLRISPDLHGRIAAAAEDEGKSLNAFVSECIEQALVKH